MTELLFNSSFLLKGHFAQSLVRYPVPPLVTITQSPFPAYRVSRKKPKEDTVLVFLLQFSLAPHFCYVFTPDQGTRMAGDMITNVEVKMTRSCRAKCGTVVVLDSKGPFLLNLYLYWPHELLAAIISPVSHSIIGRLVSVISFCQHLRQDA